MSKLWLVVLGWTLLRLVVVGGHSHRRLARYEHGRSDGTPAAGKPAEAATGGSEPGRGRQAAKPTEIPAQGWKDIFWRLYERMQRDSVMLVAAGVAFYTLLAIFPAIAALVSIYGLFADPGTIHGHLEALSGILPGGALQIVDEQVQRIASKGAGTLGLSFLFGLAVALWSANAGMKSVFGALNIVYREDEKRSFLVLNGSSLAFTLGAVLFLLVALGAVVILPLALHYLGLGPWAKSLITILRWPLLLGGMVFALALIYRYAPSRDYPQWRWVTLGSVIAAVLWLVASMLFSWYVADFGSYDATYGSLGAAIGFLTWIWISTIVVLVGAELNAEAEHQTAEDTTEGPRKPLGARGATMADTVCEAKG
ncbi:YihY/virulence factor BrkB family protein [Microvirga sp. 2MCAF38]|uniref:YihY/virulence factor BrkB family protein n=1 Tax=Microvirga sp. 2MCAF38 TaxID=3232989 RepID=UPI003F98719C